MNATPAQPCVPRLQRFEAAPETVRAIATAIATVTDPPEWLVDCLPTLIDIVHGRLTAEAEWPTRSEWRNRLSELSTAAGLVLKELQDRQLVPMLLADNGEWFDYEIEMLRGLKALVARCDARVGEIPSGSGRHKVRPVFDNAPRAETLCAIIVGLAWERHHGRWPGARNTDALKACHALWTGAAGDTTSYWSNGSTGTVRPGWANDIRSARELRGSHHAATVRRVMDGVK